MKSKEESRNPAISHLLNAAFSKEPLSTRELELLSQITKLSRENIKLTEEINALRKEHGSRQDLSILAAQVMDRARDKIDTLTKEQTLNPLTGLKNKNFRDEMGKKLFSETRTEQIYTGRENRLSDEHNFVIVYSDVNGLKMINDKLGHKAGDLLLKTYAGALRRYFHRASDILIHESGDEFMIILPATNLDKAGKFIKTAFEKINAETFFDFQDHHIHVRGAYGAVECAKSHASFSEMIEDAEILMQANKQTRKQLGLTTTCQKITS